MAMYPVIQEPEQCLFNIVSSYRTIKAFQGVIEKFKINLYTLYDVPYP